MVIKLIRGVNIIVHIYNIAKSIPHAKMLKLIPNTLCLMFVDLKIFMVSQQLSGYVNFSSGNISVNINFIEKRE